MIPTRSLISRSQPFKLFNAGNSAFSTASTLTPSAHFKISCISSSLLSTRPRRNMSSAPTSKPEWIAILPDKSDALSRRLAVRDQHLARVKEFSEKGIFTWGGVMLDEHMKDGEVPKFRGSILTIEADTKEEVWGIINSDIYVKNDVWDVEKVEIYPFRTAVRKPLAL